MRYIVCLAGILLILTSSTLCCAQQTNRQPPNILLIMVDDLRPELGCYGEQLIRSPNIDGLAGEGVVFMNAYCNFPVCGASRASFLTGLRPTRQRFMAYNTYAEKDAPGAVPMPAFFKQHGYTTISNGKIFHNKDDYAGAWNQVWRPDTENSWLNYQTPYNQLLAQGSKRGMPWERADVADTAYFDGKIADKTIADLKKLKQAGKPFFLAAGFLKPHLPFTAPEKYWAMYDGKVHQPENNYVPQQAPAISIHNSGELRNYHHMKGPIADSTALQLIHGYYACVSYTDAQVGKVLQAVKTLGLSENTIIVLMGDHGYNLQEHTMWCKHCNYNTSLRSVLIVKDPRAHTTGKSAALVEFVDIYPTLVEAAGLPSVNQLEGKSFTPLLKDPGRTWKPFIIAKYNNGVTIKTRNEAYTEWIGPDSGNRMLYDHRKDPEENINIAGRPENRKRIRKLSKTLKANWGKDF